VSGGNTANQPMVAPAERPGQVKKLIAVRRFEIAAS
jgi:hypothetical protein